MAKIKVVIETDMPLSLSEVHLIEHAMEEAAKDSLRMMHLAKKLNMGYTTLRHGGTVTSRNGNGPLRITINL